MILLDEIEKAHSDVFNVLLQILDDGRLTDGQGRTVNFANTVLIMTSNYQGDLREAFKPEFLNRIDEIVRFRSLTEEDIAKIVVIQLREPRQAPRGPAPRPGRDRCRPSLAGPARLRPVYGARPLKRLIQRTIGDHLALALLEGKYTDGDTVTVDLAPLGTPGAAEEGTLVMR